MKSIDTGLWCRHPGCSYETNLKIVFSTGLVSDIILPVFGTVLGNYKISVYKGTIDGVIIIVNVSL